MADYALHGPLFLCCGLQPVCGNIRLIFKMKRTRKVSGMSALIMKRTAYYGQVW